MKTTTKVLSFDKSIQKVETERGVILSQIRKLKIELRAADYVLKSLYHLKSVNKK